MGKKKGGGRAWKLLKLALVWARKGGVFRRGLAPGALRLQAPSYRLGSSLRSDAAVGYGEREFSFDETPVFHSMKVHRRSRRSMRLLLHHIPCINPTAASDDDDCDGIMNMISFGRNEERECWLRRRDDVDSTGERGGCRSEVTATAGKGGGATVLVLEEAEAEEKEKSSIDMEAEEFIAKFYEQMRLQRQISLLQYNESMLARSTG